MPHTHLLLHELPRWPDPLALIAQTPARYPALLESAASGTAQGRYDLLFAGPGARLELAADGTLSAAPAGGGTDFLAALDAWQASESIPAGLPLPRPFAGGWLLYLGYELAGQVEPGLALRADPAMPVASATRVPAALVRDRLRGAAWLVAEPGHDALCADILRDIATLGERPFAEPPVPERFTRAIEEDSPEEFLDGVRAIRRHVTDGDVFQVNLSREWRITLPPSLDDLAIYRRLRASNPGPFAALLREPAFTLASSSPERLLRVRDGFAETRPIAGTRPRGARRSQDRALSRELIAHPKERAEHIMLIDLERNDLGRFCRPGTIRVDELMVIESYAHVHHIVSNVRGQLRPGTTPGECIRAVFPGGTITGCPKVRCMEIIAALERTARGPYTGSVGYLGRDGSLDLNILIRTLVRRGDTASVRAGAGIVADSEPERELEETRAKAQGVLRALA